MQAGALLSLSPSFTTTYSSSGTRNLAEIAARVVNEFRQENGSNDAVFGFEDDDDVAPWEFAKEDQSLSLTNTTLPDDHDHDHEEEEGEESEFEFAFVSTEPDSSPISADEIFHNGLIKPVYPLFDQTLLLSGANNPNDVVAKKESDKTTRRRQPLRKLMVEEERETTSSCLSSEAADVDGLKQGTFCVWKPKSDAGDGDGDGAGGCRKKNGSSMRWKIRDILSRSRSVGKEGFVLVAPTKKVAGGGRRGFRRAGKVEAVAEKEKEKNDVVLGENDEGERGVKSKEEDKKRSFLPYKQDLVGFLANVNGLSRNLHPF